jgi:hypothetical protein
MGYVVRHGRQIEVETIQLPSKPRRKAFEPRFVQVPRHWISALGRSKSVNTYRLALLILFAAFKDKQRNGEVTLSSAMTGMPRNTKVRAARELADLGLIQLLEGEAGALRARVISNKNRKREYKN